MAHIAVDSIEIGENTYILTLPYGVCETPAEESEKKVSVPNFSLDSGARIAIKFINSNSALEPLLNVNETGARVIKYRDNVISNKFLVENTIYEFIYDGLDWEVIGGAGSSEDAPQIANTITPGLVKAGRDIVVDVDGNVTIRRLTASEVESAWNQIFK